MARNSAEISQYQHRFIEAIFKHIKRKELQSKMLGLHDACDKEFGIWFELSSEKLADIYPNTILLAKNSGTVFRCQINYMETTVACWLATFQDAHPNIYKTASKLEEIERIETLEKIRGTLEQLEGKVSDAINSAYADAYDPNRALRFAIECYGIATHTDMKALIEEMQEHELI